MSRLTMWVLADTLLERVAEIISRYSMLPAGTRIGVAVSGGADSVVLLNVLIRLSDTFQIVPIVVHVNHALRGSESEDDEQFVRQLAAQSGLACLLGAGPLGPNLDPSGNVEQAARDARRTWFHKWKADGHVDRVALGHTESDQAETVLYRLLRGSGLAGLSGMRLVSKDGLIRPLLTTTRQEVRKWAQAEGLTWRDDSSNSNRAFDRNRLRLDTIPELERNYNPRLTRSLARMSQMAQAEEDYWSQEIPRHFAPIAERSQYWLILNLAEFYKWHPAIQRRVIRRAIEDTRGDLRSIDFEHVEALVNLCRRNDGHDRVMLPGVDALRSYGHLRIIRTGTEDPKRHYNVPVVLGTELRLPFAAGCLRVDFVNREADFCANVKGEGQFGLEQAELDAGRLTEERQLRPIYIRNWEPGDAIVRPGQRKPEKLKFLFQEQKILLWQRRHWPVMIFGDEIVWTRRFGPAAAYAAGDGCSEMLVLEYREQRHREPLEDNRPIATDLNQRE